MLDFRQAPPLSIPLRFMLTAPLFGIAGASLLLWSGADALHSRWQPATFASLHCFTAGFMMQAMIGALWQVMPVVAGVVIVRPALVAALSHVGLTVGATLLVAGMLGTTFSSPVMVTAGAALMTASIAIFIGASLPGLVRSGLRAESARLLALALVGLGGTAVAGLVLARSLFGGQPLDDIAGLIDLHATWAFAGWALPLVAAVALQFVPMFYMTTSYPRLADVYLGALGLALLLSLCAMFFEISWMRLAGAGVACLGAIGFAAVTLWRFARRRRPKRDATSIGWQLAMTAVLGSVVLLVVRVLVAETPFSSTMELAFGALAVLGVFVTLIGAMLMRILPFLASLHLAAGGGGWRLDHAPGDRAQRVQVWLQAIAAVTMASAAALPELARWAAALLLASQLLLARNTWGYAWALRRAQRKLPHE